MFLRTRILRGMIKCLIVIVLGSIIVNHLQPKKSIMKLEYIVVHFDLKGSPPKLSYLESLLPLLKAHNVNGLLMEYEDMFPYEGKLANLSARNCYNKKELENFLRVAGYSGFEIIPLIQTFGHLEYALKLPEFKHLREEPMYPDSICSSKKESIVFLEEMLQQVITFHVNILPLKYIHIGCDEVYHMNTCEDCSKRNLTNIDLFLQHVSHVSGYIQASSPHIAVLVWDDMFRDIPPDAGIRTKLPNVVPVYWNYCSSDYREAVYRRLYAYQRIFGKMWVASAFKGADGHTQILPNMKVRYLNHVNWLNVIHNYGIGSDNYVYTIEGIILTGWSRYSHMQPPCELLPASVPSLVINLRLIQMYLSGKASKHCDMDKLIDLYLQTNWNSSILCHIMGCDITNRAACSFQGSDLYGFLLNYIDFRKHFAWKIGSRYNTDFPEHGYQMVIYNRGYFDINFVAHMLDWCNNAQQILFNMKSQMVKLMSKYFDEYVVEEYVYFNIGEMQKDINTFIRLLKNVNPSKIWRWPVDAKISLE